MESVKKRNVMERLRAVGLWKEADAYREEARLRHRNAGDDRKTATAKAWDEVWQVYHPIVERLEAKGTDEPQLRGLPVDLNLAIDPDYSETDQGRQLRDGLLWSALEWMKVIQDTPDGPVANLAAASTPPPNSWALMVLSTYALGGIDKRRELITKAMSFAPKAKDDAPGSDSGNKDGDDGDSFLHLIGGE